MNARGPAGGERFANGPKWCRSVNTWPIFRNFPLAGTPVTFRTRSEGPAVTQSVA